MVKTKLIQSSLEDLKRITRADFALYSGELKLIFSTFPKNTVNRENLAIFMDSSAGSQNIDDIYYIKLNDADEQFALLVNARGADGYMLSRIAASELVHLMGLSAERLSKESFYKDVLYGNIVNSDTAKMAAKLKLDADIERVVFAIKVDDEARDGATELVKNMYSEKNDYVFLDEQSLLILIKDMTGYDDAQDVASEIVSMINTEIMAKANVTYARPIRGFETLADGFREATMAMEVAQIFYDNRQISSYDSLGIGRLIQQLPKELCQNFLDQVLGSEGEGAFLDEDISLMNKLFDNNLNVAETARATGISRTTLIYRFERIYKRTGYDLRVFEDALTIKIAMMIAKYLSKF